MKGTGLHDEVGEVNWSPPRALKAILGCVLLHFENFILMGRWRVRIKRIQVRDPSCRPFRRWRWKRTKNQFRPRTQRQIVFFLISSLVSRGGITVDSGWGKGSHMPQPQASGPTLRGLWLLLLELVVLTEHQGARNTWKHIFFSASFSVILSRKFPPLCKLDNQEFSMSSWFMIKDAF